MKLEQSIHMVLVAGGGSSNGSSSERSADLLSGRNEAWQRAMEQAEYASWFKGSGGESQSAGAAVAKEATFRSGMTTGLSMPTSRYSLFQSTQSPRLLADSKGEPSAADSSYVGGSTSSTKDEAGSDAGHASRNELRYGSGNGAGYAVADATQYAMREKSDWGLGELGFTLNAIVPSLHGVVTPVTSSSVELAVTATSATGTTSVVLPRQIVVVPASNGSLGPVCGEDELIEAEASRVSSSQEGTTNTDPGPKIRIHVDWTEDGVRVWLGVDHDAEAALPQVQRQLDHVLTQSGSQLLSLVCNGRTLVGSTDRPTIKGTSSAAPPPRPYQQGFQAGDCPVGQPMFHLDEQVER